VPPQIAVVVAEPVFTAEDVQVPVQVPIESIPGQGLVVTLPPVDIPEDPTIYGADLTAADYSAVYTVQNVDIETTPPPFGANVQSPESVIDIGPGIIAAAIAEAAGGELPTVAMEIPLFDFEESPAIVAALETALDILLANEAATPARRLLQTIPLFAPDGTITPALADAVDLGIGCYVFDFAKSAWVQDYIAQGTFNEQTMVITCDANMAIWANSRPGATPKFVAMADPRVTISRITTPPPTTDDALILQPDPPEEPSSTMLIVGVSSIPVVLGMIACCVWPLCWSGGNRTRAQVQKEQFGGQSQPAANDQAAAQRAFMAKVQFAPRRRPFQQI
jgi:hypothetical protein